MCAHGFDGVGGSEDPAVLASARDNLGAHAVGAYVFFSVYIPDADIVYLVGTFNSWKESCPMSKGDDGIWRVSLPSSEIPEGIPYKYKVVRERGTVYITDPYTKMTDGAPYFNSVYAALPKKAKKVSSSGVLGALNIYEVNVRNWIKGLGGGLPDYTFFAKELVPYVLQMGYSHVSLTGIFEEYYDHSAERWARAYFSAEPKQGGIKSFSAMVRLMQSLGIRVLIELGIEKSFGDRNADIGFYTECALYWLDRCGADGLMICSDGLHDDEFFSLLSHNVKAERHGALLVSKAENGNILGCDVSVSDRKRYEELLPCANTREGELRIRAAAAAYLLFAEGKMLTRMGQEIGGDACAEGCLFDRALLDKKPNAVFQLFMSEMNNNYLENSALFESDEVLGCSDMGGIRVMKRSLGGDEIILAMDVSGEGGEFSLEEKGEWERRVCFDGHTYGFSALYNAGGIIHASLPPYGLALFERIL